MIKNFLKINITTLVLVTVFFPASFAKAESIVWSKTLTESFSVTNAKSAYRMHTLDKPNIQIRYNSRVLNTDTGQVLSCGAKVAPGTKIRFEFIDHAYTDVAWFATGTAYDSPYGSWNVDGGRSPGSICDEKNFYKISQQVHRGKWAFFTEKNAAEEYYRLKNYMDFSVNPPTKTISGLTDVAGCQTLSNGNVECKINEEKTLSASFNFGETFSQMFYGFKILANIYNPEEKCYATENPLSKLTSAVNNFVGNDRGGFELTASVGSLARIGGGGGFSTTPARKSAPIKIPIPAQNISCPIYVAAVGTNTPPSAPKITVNNGDKTCVSGANISYGATSVDADRDPEDSQLRYLIDWDSDGSTDQTVPSTGYVSSNTTQTFNFVTRDTDAEQTFRVAAQDKGGLLSPWVSFKAARCVNEELIVDPNLLNPVLPSELPESYGPGEVEFSLNPSVTNSVCKATWSAKNVSACSLYKNGALLKAVEVSGQMDLTPGKYELRCQELRGGGTISVSKEQTCFLNPDFREL